MDKPSPNVQKELQPKWKNAPSTNDLKQDLKEAQSNHSDQVNKVEEWLDNLNITGAAKLKESHGRSSITPKLIRKHAEWRYASLSEPLHTAATLFTTKPVTAEDVDIAEQDSLILNHQFENEIDKIALIDEAVRTAVDEGTVIYRVGWELETAIRKSPVPVQRDGQIIGTTLVEREVTTVSRPTVDVVDYRAVIIDPSARGDINKAQFVIYKYPTNISELKAQGYQNLDQIDVNSMALDETDIDANSYGFNFSDTARKEITAYEYWGYWDINDDNVLVPIVATFVGDVMIRLKENPFPDRKLPFVVSHYLPVRGHNYGEPDGVLLEDNQKINGAVTRGIIDIMGKSANGQIGRSENALDAPNQLKFDRGEDYTYRQGTDPSKSFYTHVYPEVPASAYNMLQMQATEAESMTGIKTYGDGVSGASLGDTAAGVKGALGAASKRESGILRRMAKGLEDVAKKVMSMNEVFLEQEQIERITGKPYVDPQPGLRTTDVRVKIRTAEEDAQLASDLAFMTQTIGNTLDPKLTQLLLTKISRLKNMPDVADAIANFEPAPDPVASEIQQLEVELLKAKIANEYAKASENNANGVLDTAKAQTETARAAHLQSQTDLNKLDYVEEETGTNHERALDLMRTQAEGNIHLKAFEKTTEDISKEK